MYRDRIDNSMSYSPGNPYYVVVCTRLGITTDNNIQTARILQVKSLESINNG